MGRRGTGFFNHIVVTLKAQPVVANSILTSLDPGSNVFLSKKRGEKGNPHSTAREPLRLIAVERERRIKGGSPTKN